MKKFVTFLIVSVLLVVCMPTKSFARDNSGFLKETAIIDDNLGIIYGLREGISQEEFITTYVNKSSDIEVVFSGNIATGTSINILNAKTDEVLCSYKILIIGDVNSDGYCNGMDAVVVESVCKGLISLNTVDSVFKLAFDTNKDGVITNDDSYLLEDAGLFLLSIDQTSIYKPVEKYSVTFYDYDGITVLDTKTGIPEGECATLPDEPSKAGATFMGWEGNYYNVVKDERVRAIYSDEKNVFFVESTSANIGDTVTVLVSVDGVVKTCGFDFTILYDSNLELISFDSDLDLDIVANTGVIENGVILNFSSASDKTKQRDVIELTFKIKDTTKRVLPITIDINSVKEVSGSHIINAEYTVVNGLVEIQ